MEAACFDSKSAGRYVRELSAFRRRHRHLRGIYLIHDNDPTHTATKTSAYLAGCSGWWRSRAEFIDYVGQAWPEYNRLYAHPFQWTWSSQKMRQWVEKHGL